MTVMKERKSNIELLRIFTICGVIILHYNNPLIGSGITFASGINKVVLYFVESICACAVDLFMLISGYFMCVSYKRNLSKPLSLVFQVASVALGIYLLKCLLGLDVVTVKGIVRRCIPTNYFAILYISVYFISPVINVIFRTVSKQGAKRILVILFMLVSVWPTVVDLMSELIGNEWVGLSSIGMYGSQWGYTVINFAFMYYIGGYIRHFGFEIGNLRKQLLLLIMSTCCLSFWAFANDYTGFFTERSAWEYCNPLVIFNAILIFNIFSRISIKQSRVINSFAKASFMVFLLQNNFFKYINISKYVSGLLPVMLLHMLLSAVGIYVICWGIDFVYQLTLNRLFTHVLTKVKLFSYDLYDKCFNQELL